MKSYYIGGISFNGENAISHGRTKGSKNGISHTPGYVAIGELAGKVSTAARSVGNKASGVARSVGRTAKKTYSSGKEFITGSNARKALKKANNMTSAGSHWTTTINDYRELGRSSKKQAANNRADASRYSTTAKKFASSAARNKNTVKVVGNPNAIDMAGNSGYRPGIASNAARRAERDELMAEKFKGRANESDQKAKRNEKHADYYYNTAAYLEKGRNQKQLAKNRATAAAQRAYDKTLPGKIEKAKTKLGSVASKKMSEVSAWASTTSGKAKEAARKAKTAVRSAGSTAISKISTGASSTAGKVKSFVSGLFGKKKK